MKTLLCLFLTISLHCPVSGKSKLVARLDAGEKQVVVAYGTSLTAAGTWVKQLSTALDERYPGQTRVINSGGSGQWSAWGVENLEAKVLRHKPDAVFIEFSINDSVARFECTVDAARKNLESMIASILKTNPECGIILMTMTPGDKHPVGHPSHRKDIESHYEMYRTVAKERNLLLIDHYPNWKTLQLKNKALFESYVPDSIHATDEGCLKVVTPAIWKALGIHGIESQGTPP